MATAPIRVQIEASVVFCHENAVRAQVHLKCASRARILMGTPAHIENSVIPASVGVHVLEQSHIAQVQRQTWLAEDRVHKGRRR